MRSRRRRRPYRVVAEVTQVTDQALIVDFGIPALARSYPAPDNLAPGDFITGDLTLLFYSATVEYVRDEAREIDALNQYWDIQAVTKRSAPLIPVFDRQGVQQYFIRDDAHATYEKMDRTDGLSAVPNEDTSVDYNLRCRLLNVH